MIQLSNLEHYKSKVAEFLETKLNELEFAEDWELMDDPLLVPVYVDSNGKLTLEKQTELRSAKGARVLLYRKDSLSSSILKNVEFESLVFSNLKSTSGTTGTDGPFYYTLYECPKIKKIYFPELKSIPQYGMKGFLYDCPNLSLVEFPKLESIGTWGFQWSFRNCPKLKDVYFPSVVSVGDGVFAYCDSNTKFHFKKSLANDPKFSSSNLDIPASKIVFDI